MHHLGSLQAFPGEREAQLPAVTIKVQSKPTVDVRSGLVLHVEGNSQLIFSGFSTDSHRHLLVLEASTSPFTHPGHLSQDRVADG